MIHIDTVVPTRRWRLVAGSLATLICAVHAAAAQGVTVSGADLARVDSVFADHRGAAHPGYAVAIMQRGRTLYSRGFGSADIERGIPIGPASVFNVASLSKQFTAACIGILIRRGRISLEDEVSRHIPAFPGFPGPVRIKHLVYMTSGLAEYYTVPRAGGLTWNDPFTNEDAIAASLRQPAQFAPGTRWAYSNVNYMILADIVRRVSGMSFAEFAQRELFTPLGMTSSHFNVDLGRPVPGRAEGYNAVAGGGYRREVRRSPHFGGSGLFTTVQDLARWNRGFETNQLGGAELTATLLATMQFEHSKVNDAFGLVWGQHRGHRTLWYEGGDAGFSSYMVRLPDSELSVIVLSNSGTGGAAERGRRILDVIVR